MVDREKTKMILLRATPEEKERARRLAEERRQSMAAMFLSLMDQEIRRLKMAKRRTP